MTKTVLTIVGLLLLAISLAHFARFVLQLGKPLSFEPSFIVVAIIGLYLVSREHGRELLSFVRGTTESLPVLDGGKGKSKVGTDTVRVEKVIEKGTEQGPILGMEASPPPPDEWYTELRPVLHQASHYTVPTYYLDLKLRVIDWNVAFELVFQEIIGKLRHKHVTWFIAQLDNRDEVFDHAREFTERVRQGGLPLVDIEPLRYRSSVYGRVSLMKVATQLHSPTGNVKGWAVSLIVRDIDWGKFERNLFREIHQDKLWSVYGASYDRVLLEFPPYTQLVRDVISVVPGNGRSVIDLGAGTGNVTLELLKRGHRVTAVENNIVMLDRFRAKVQAARGVTVVKTSVEHLESLKDKTFDAAVMVNVLYAVDHPLACLRGIHRVLKPEGVFAFSTTHSETHLDPLLERIKQVLRENRKLGSLRDDYENVHAANKEIEQTIARRHSRNKYREWLKHAGFEIIKEEPSTYEGAVMLIHARKNGNVGD